MTDVVTVKAQVVEVATGVFEDHSAFGSSGRDQCLIRVTKPADFADRIVRVVIDDRAAADLLRPENRVAFELHPPDLDLDVVFSGALENLRRLPERAR